MKFNSNLVSGALCLTASMVFFILIPSQIKMTGNSLINSQTFPKILLSTISICSIFLIIKGILIREKDLHIKMTSELRTVVSIVLLLLYAFLLNIIGFFFSSVVYCYSLLIFYRSKNIKYYVIVTIVCYIATFIFKNFLKVQLP